MALGKFSDINLADTAAITGGAWSPDLPATNLAARRYLTAPARQLAPADLGASQFEVAFDRARAVTLVGLMFHTLSLTARYRLTIAGVDGVLATPAYSSGWLTAYPRLYPTSQLPWEEPNTWAGYPLGQDLDLYPRHLWLSVSPGRITTRLRVEVDDATNPAGYFDIGGLWVALGWSPLFNFDRGRELGMDARDQIDEAPSGRLFSEERTPRRRSTVTWSGLTNEEAYRLFDAGARARTTRPVLFVPDVDQTTSLVREAWPSTFETLPKPRFAYDRLNTITATFKELIA